MGFFKKEYAPQQEQNKSEVEVIEINFDKEKEIFDGRVKGMTYYYDDARFYAFENPLRDGGEFMIDIRHDGPTQHDVNIGITDKKNVEKYKRIRSEAEQKILEAIKNYQAMEEKKKLLKDIPHV